jgi:hypothetical protein
VRQSLRFFVAIFSGGSHLLSNAHRSDIHGPICIQSEPKKSLPKISREFCASEPKALQGFRGQITPTIAERQRGQRLLSNMQRLTVDWRPKKSLTKNSREFCASEHKVFGEHDKPGERDRPMEHDKPMERDRSTTNRRSATGRSAAVAVYGRQPGTVRQFQTAPKGNSKTISWRHAAGKSPPGMSP